MNQLHLYETLKECKILSFEDYPSLHGSWRVNFICEKSLFEVSSNRPDNILSLTKKDNGQITQQSNIESQNPLTDQLELAIIKEWIVKVD